MRYIYSIITLLVLVFILPASARDKQGRVTSFNKPLAIGVLDTMNINNIYLPFQNDGSTAENAQAYYPNGTDLSFLYQGGIAATGYVNGELRASWMAKASLIQELQPGKWGMDPDDARAKFYVVTANDGPGSQAYINWADAVALGADFQDVDGNGVYDPNIDRPDLLGDRTSWTVYNDGTDVSIRSEGLQTEPMGLEIHQQVWAFARADELGNVIFFRYRFINFGGEDIDNFIFSIWADPDIGDAVDDLIGCDTTLSLGYIYNNGSDAEYGSNPPAFGVDFFQGPVVESPGDTAFLYRGPWFGIDTVYDKSNLPMTAFTFYNNAGETDPFPTPQQNVQRARDYQEGGLNGHGVPIDPTVFGTGGQPSDNPKYFYSGEPEAGTGWRDATEADKRFLVNTGPFNLLAWQDLNGNERADHGEPGVQDIVVAYVVGQGDNPTNSVTELKRVDRIAQVAYDANFFVAGPPPPPKVTTRTFNKKIEFIIDLDANGTYDYDQLDKLLNRQVFEGVKIYQLNSPSTNERQNDLLNRKIIASFDVDNKYKDILVRDGIEIRKVYTGNNMIDTTTFADNGGAVLRFVVEQDAFATAPPRSLINNVEYYFSITAFSVNHGGDPPFLDSLGNGAWLGGAADLLENNLGGNQLHRVTPFMDENRPFKNDTAAYIGTRANYEGQVLVDVVNRDLLTGHDYSVRFFNDGNFYRIFNETQNELLRDSLVYQDSVGGSSWSYPITDGLSIKVQDVSDGLKTALAMVDTSDTNNVVWLAGSRAYNTVATSVFDSSVCFIKQTNRSNLSTGYTKDTYFPVKLVFETSDVSMAHHYRANWNLFAGLKSTFVSAYDISNPNQPVKLNIAYLNPAPTGAIDFSSGNEIVIFRSEYDEAGRYSGGASADPLFKDESYLIGQLSLVADSLKQVNPMEITVKPFYPNCDADVFLISSKNLLPTVTSAQKKNQLEKVNVVPNPYWAYSAYETSYDTPVIKFTHLPEEVVIRIFDLAGSLIKTLSKNDASPELFWNLRNEANLKIASGMYIVHIEASGIGSKVLKFAVVQREERLDRF